MLNPLIAAALVYGNGIEFVAIKANDNRLIFKNIEETIWQSAHSGTKVGREEFIKMLGLDSYLTTSIGMEL